MKLKILFTDDDPNVQRMVKIFLRDARFEVVYAKNGRSALKLYQQHGAQFDLLLTDVQMPEMDGITLTQEIRKENKNIPIIVVSAFGQENIAKDCLEKGATMVLPKPFGSKSLIEAIDKVTKTDTKYITGSGS